MGYGAVCFCRRDGRDVERELRLLRQLTDIQHESVCCCCCLSLFYFTSAMVCGPLFISQILLFVCSSRLLPLLTPVLSLIPMWRLLCGLFFVKSCFVTSTAADHVCRLLSWLRQFILF